MTKEPTIMAESLLSRASKKEGSFVTAYEARAQFRLEVHRLPTDTIVVLFRDREPAFQYSLARGLEFDSGYRWTGYFCDEIRRRADEGQRI